MCHSSPSDEAWLIICKSVCMLCCQSICGVFSVLVFWYKWQPKSYCTFWKSFFLYHTHRSSEVSQFVFRLMLSSMINHEMSVYQWVNMISTHWLGVWLWWKRILLKLCWNNNLYVNKQVLDTNSQTHWRVFGIQSVFPQQTLQHQENVNLQIHRCL